MYTERYRVIMSLGCYVPAIGISFSIPLTETILIKDTEISIDQLTIDFLKKYIWEKEYDNLKELVSNASKLDLWHVNVDDAVVDDAVGVYTEEYIVQKLGGKKMKPLHLFNSYFNQPLEKEKIHIIVQPPATTASLSFKEIIEVIQKNASNGRTSLPDVLSMPLQQRDFEKAMRRVKETIISNITRQSGKSNYWCLVSGGAPGIGKTRFGQELFDQVRKDIPQCIQDTYNDIPYDKNDKRKTEAHVEYLYIDFGNDHELTQQDYGIDASIIVGLRIAHAFFIEKEYGMTFQQFCVALKQYRDSFNNFHFDDVIDEYRKSLNLSDNHLFYLYLHIDEFQLIDSWDKEDKSNPPTDLFRNMIHNISKFMAGPRLPTFIQPFFSGTAPQAVIKHKKASRISFDFVECPLLNDESIIKIMDHFADKFNAGIANYVYKWKYCRQMLQLLRDTGGLPRALQRLFIECFGKNGEQGREFFKKLESKELVFMNYFVSVKDSLNLQYGIKDYVKKNKEVAMKLMYYCIEGTAINPDECLDNNNPDLTIRSLEEDKHIILEQSAQSDNFSLIKMPFYFICIYNDVLEIVDPTLEKKSYDDDMCWGGWEIFVAYHEAFRTNLAIKMGNTTMTLRELYPNADESEVSFDMSVKLKPLRVCKAYQQFPHTKKLTEKFDGEEIDWKSGGVVVINGSSAQFADVFFVRECEDADDKKFLMMNQCKWDYGSTKMSESKVEDEDEKNLMSFYECIDEDSYMLITILFTSQPYIKEGQKPGVLVVSKEDFKIHFGPVFSSRASLAITGDTNPNFWEKNRLKNVLGGIGDLKIDDVIKKRPYFNDDDFYKKNPSAKKQQKMDYFPFDVSGRLSIENR